MSAPSLFGLFLRLTRPSLVVDASNADWNFGNNIFNRVVDGRPGDAVERIVDGIETRQACLRVGGAWTLESSLNSDEDEEAYPNWFVQLLFVLVFLLSVTLFTTLYLVWLCFGRRNFRYLSMV